MRIVILGPPAGGKGTQAKKLCEHFNLTHISTGDLLRQAVKDKTPLGLEAEKYMSAGQLVPDELVISLIEARLRQSDCDKGVVLDGFPRTKRQALALTKKGIEVDCVLNLHVADEKLIERAVNRRVHLASGRMYHLFFNPPLIPGRDDITGEPLTHRDDDNEDALKARLAVYHARSQPLIQYYQYDAIQTTFHHIAGDGTPDVISTQIIQKIRHLFVASAKSEDDTEASHSLLASL